MRSSSSVGLGSGDQELIPMTDPWDWYIYVHLPLSIDQDVGKYASPMDPSWDRNLEMLRYKLLVVW